MFIATKNTKVIAIHETEWQCRRKAKGLDKSAYWTWLATVTSGDPPVSDFSGEDYEIVETDAPLSYQDDEGNTISFNQSGHIHDGHYHLKWDGSKIVKDDDALTTYQTAEKWKDVRSQRDRLLNETDWVVVKAKETGSNISAAWKNYRQSLRDITKQLDVHSLDWPIKPS